jgi:hypothetical protein
MEQNQENKVNYHGHYYGRLVRIIFIIAGIIMIATFPFFSHLINLPLPITLFAVLVLVIVGGLLNPLSKWVFIIGSIIPMCAFIMFEYYAYYAYHNLPSTNPINVNFFWVNQILALIFFFATYLSVKTLRAMIQGKMSDEPW